MSCRSRGDQPWDYDEVSRFGHTGGWVISSPRTHSPRIPRKAQTRGGQRTGAHNVACAVGVCVYGTFLHWDNMKSNLSNP